MAPRQDPGKGRALAVVMAVLVASVALYVVVVTGWIFAYAVGWSGFAVLLAVVVALSIAAWITRSPVSAWIRRRAAAEDPVGPVDQPDA